MAVFDMLQWALAALGEHLRATTGMGALEYAGMALGIVGQLFVARRSLAGFRVWIVSNVCLVIVFLDRRLMGAALLNVYFSFGNVYAIWEWRRARWGVTTPRCAPVEPT